MISYAQNFEDVILHRAFRNQDSGFYIDVGAWEETRDSVTKHFYQIGWNGINIEPIARYLQEYDNSRPRDINLNVALLDHPGTMTLYDFPGTGLSTFDAGHAHSHESKGLEAHESKVYISTLSAVCEEHVKDRQIDFLKIDTEGTELRVLQGGDWKRFRPRIVLIEATRPNSREPSHTEWEPFLLEQGYIFSYFDGLNRFYVRKEEPDLALSLFLPPNIFDEFITYRTALAEARIEELERRLLSAMKKADRLDTMLKSPLGRIVSRII